MPGYKFPIFDMYGLHEVIHRLSSALNQLKLENPGRRFPILSQLDQIKTDPDARGRTWRSPLQRLGLLTPGKYLKL